MEEIGDLLECPVCNEHPRPDLIWIGQCPLGHLLCHSCTRRVQLSPYAWCPKCRQAPMKIIKSHHFIFSVIKLYTSQKVYECSFDNCSHLAKGPKILTHEKECELKPVPCPKVDCPFSGPIAQYLNNKHDCFTPVSMSSTDKNHWSFAIPIQEFFNLDTNTTEGSHDFTLRFLSDPQNTSRAYFGFNNKFGDLIFYVGWLGDRKWEKEDRNYTLRVSVDNKVGPIGGLFMGTCKLFNDRIECDRDGLYVKHNKLLQWIFWMAGQSQPQFLLNFVVKLGI